MDKALFPDQFGPKPGWYALSVNNIYSRDRQYRYFLSFEPVAMAGYSIYIYRVTLDEANRVRRELGLKDWRAPIPKRRGPAVEPKIENGLTFARRLALFSAWQELTNWHRGPRGSLIVLFRPISWWRGGSRRVRSPFLFGALAVVAIHSAVDHVQRLQGQPDEGRDRPPSGRPEPLAVWTIRALCDEPTLCAIDRGRSAGGWRRRYAMGTNPVPSPGPW